MLMVSCDEGDVWGEIRFGKTVKRGAGCVYVVSAVGTPYVKVGKSDDPEARLNSLQVGCPFPLRLVAAALVGSIANRVEEGAHRRLEPFRYRGEWFEVPPSVVLAILWGGTQDEHAAFDEGSPLSLDTWMDA